jgi:NAD(P)-dependent dehydrogenase (short-subunit alcohol dehydrogenase family)
MTFAGSSKPWTRDSGLWILINNAGIGIYKPVLDLAPEEWHRMIDFKSQRGLLLLTRGVTEDGRPRRIHHQYQQPGRENAFAGGAGYNASKFGLNGFTEACDDGPSI